VKIELKDLTKIYSNGALKAVDNVSMTFEEKKLTVLIGPSGCGKTTTLKMINRLIERTSGDILFDNQSIDNLNTIDLRRSTGYAIQDIGLFPHMDVHDNIAVVPRLLKWPDDKIHKRVVELLELVNLDPDINLHKYPAQLSGGQKQRIGVARSLAADPDVILMDEPFGAIDPINREKLQDAFLEIQQKIKKTIIFVTHDIREAIKLGDKIVILDNGKIVQYDDTINVVNNPHNEFVESLLGSDRALKGLEMLRVKDNYITDFASINLTETKTVGSAIDLIEKNKKKFMLVVGKKGKLKGYVTLKYLKKRHRNDMLEDHVKPTESIQPFSNLMEAITTMVEAGITSCPVVNSKDKLLGIIRFKTLVDIMGQFEHNEE